VRWAALGALVAGCTALVDPDRSRLDTKPRCETADDCDDGLYCNGAEECIARVCVTGDEPCADTIPCTVDLCDEDTHECEFDPRDERCAQDPVPQRCDAEDGCVPL